MTAKRLAKPSVSVLVFLGVVLLNTHLIGNFLKVHENSTINFEHVDNSLSIKLVIRFSAKLVSFEKYQLLNRLSDANGTKTQPFPHPFGCLDRGEKQGKTGTVVEVTLGKEDIGQLLNALYKILQTNHPMVDQIRDCIAQGQVFHCHINRQIGHNVVFHTDDPATDGPGKSTLIFFLGTDLFLLGEFIVNFVFGDNKESIVGWETPTPERKQYAAVVKPGSFYIFS